MDSETMARLLFSTSFTPFDLITVSGHEYLVEKPEHCRLMGEHSLALWSQAGDVELIDVRLIERVRINDVVSFGKFEKFAK